MQALGVVVALAAILAALGNVVAATQPILLPPIAMHGLFAALSDSGRVSVAAEGDTCPSIIFDETQASIRCDPGPDGDAYCEETFTVLRSDTCSPTTRTCIAKPAINLPEDTTGIAEGTWCIADVAPLGLGENTCVWSQFLPNATNDNVLACGGTGGIDAPVVLYSCSCSERIPECSTTAFETPSIRCDPGPDGDTYCSNTFTPGASTTCNQTTNTCNAKPLSVSFTTNSSLLGHPCIGNLAGVPDERIGNFTEFNCIKSSYGRYALIPSVLICLNFTNPDAVTTLYDCDCSDPPFNCRASLFERSPSPVCTPGPGGDAYCNATFGQFGPTCGSNRLCAARSAWLGPPADAEFNSPCMVSFDDPPDGVCPSFAIGGCTNVCLVGKYLEFFGPVGGPACAGDDEVPFEFYSCSCEAPPPAGSNNTPWIVAVAVLGAVLLACIIAVVLVASRRSRSRSRRTSSRRRPTSRYARL